MSTGASEAQPGAGASISIVVPVYAGADYLPRLVAEVETLREGWMHEGAPVCVAELILVDDSAVDDSPRIIDCLAAERPWIVPLHLSRNFGQHGATIAGILHSSGDWVATLDEDMQHPPHRIPDLLSKAVLVGADVVYARPAGGVHETVFRDLASRSFKRFMQWLTNNPNMKHFNSFRLLRGPIARAASSVCTHDTYFDVSLCWFTQRIAAQSMTLKDERYIRTGRSGYTLRSLLAHAWRMLFSSHIRFLRLGSVLGMTILTLSVVGTIYLLFLKLLYPAEVQVQGWTSIILALTFFGGISVFMLGLILQYLSTMVLKAHGKPTFFTIDRSTDADLARWFGGRAL